MIVVKRIRWIAACAALLIAIAWNGPVYAQGVTTGAITGSVTDESGQPVVGAEIQVTHRATGFRAGTLSRTNGQYLIQGLEVGGPYTVRIRSLGQQEVVRGDIYVRL